MSGCQTPPTPDESGLLCALRSGRWRKDERARFALRLWAVLALPVLVGALWTYTATGLTNGAGKVIGEDFIDYWMGARFAWEGRGVDVYNFDVFLTAVEHYAGQALEPYQYSYPPTYMLMSLPLAGLDFLPALALWTIGGGVMVFALAKPLIGSRGAVLAVLGSPVVFVNALYGQNGTLSAALLGGGLLALANHPIVAGVLIGLLSYKPQLGILIPIALAVGGYWRAFWSAGVSVMLLAAGATVFIGWEAWPAFVDRMGLSNAYIFVHGQGVWHRMLSTFVAARVLGASPDIAWMMHVPVALAAVYGVVAVWRRDALPSVKATALVLATFLASPYVWDYDLVVLVVVFAWRLKEGQWKPWEATALVLCLATPFLLSPAVKLAHMPIGPLLVGWAFWTVVSRRPVNQNSMVGNEK